MLTKISVDNELIGKPFTDKSEPGLKREIRGITSSENLHVAEDATWNLEKKMCF